MAVGLGKVVYLWNAANKETSELMEVKSTGNYICSVSWGFQGSYLAVGTALGRVEVSVQCLIWGVFLLKA